ncbi:MAG: DNA replication/repair protein RecF [Clostridiales Family XIII bacterium]|jgi:DNA replication and repair protein RecF|nr:DNA replication/repair protein RecF [Clostridiales Family XIII bacterium]
MFIKTLALQNFRNYEERSVDFDAGVNILTGNNGEGKTNMLEAVRMLSMGRSFRTQNDAEAILFGKSFFRIKGLFERGGDDLTVEVRAQGSAKSYFIDGIKVPKGADLLDHALTVIFSPDDLRIVKDGPEKRRHFMDHELFQLKPLYYLDVIKYRRIVKNRNLLLKEMPLNEPLLDVYDGYLAETGARIMAERAGFAARLAKVSAGIQDRITASSDPRPAEDPAAAPAYARPAGEPAAAPACARSAEDPAAAPAYARPAEEPAEDTAATAAGLEVSYEPSIEMPEPPDSDAQGAGAVPRIQEAIVEQLRSRRAKDVDAGSTTRGPHKDDLKLVSGGVDLRKYGSQGQQRTAALALKLAEVDIIKEETGEMPILLLDDVLSELDESRQRCLIGSFEDCQIIITAADLPTDLRQAFAGAHTIRAHDG